MVLEKTERANIVTISRSDWATQNMMTPERHRISLDFMPWWKPIYNRSYKNWHHSIIITGRQMGKSTANFVNCIEDVNIGGTVAIYAMPTDPHVTELSKTKFDPMYKSVSNIMPMITTDNVHEKIFSNGSAVFFKYLYGGREAIRVRGTTASGLYLDEIQDIVVDQIPIIQETLSFRRYEGQTKWQTLSGTHKSRLSTANVYWKMSTQREWFVKCESCGKWNYPDERIIGDTCLICSHCGKGIAAQNGQWVRTGPADAIWEGFRLPQTLSPFMPFDANVADSINYKKRFYSRQRFYNEVLCLPFDSGVLWLTPDQLHGACRETTQYFDNLNDIPSGDYTLGVDWGSPESEGNSDTVVTVINTRAGIHCVCFVKRFEAGDGDFDEQVSRILNIAKQFKARLICADWGFGAYQNKRMKNAGVCPVTEVQYVSQKQFSKFDNNSGRWYVDRTQALERMKVDIVERGLILFPPIEKIKNIEKHFYALERIEDYVKNKVTYEHDVINPDDAVHSLFYAIFAAQHSY